MKVFLPQVWGIGDYCSTTHDKRCTTENIRRFFEVLEALTYELSAMIASTTASSIYHAKIISMLMSTLAKVLDLCFCLVINHLHISESMLNFMFLHGFIAVISF